MAIPAWHRLGLLLAIVLAWPVASFCQSDNDLFTNSTAVTVLGTEIVGYNVGATMEAGEPNHAAPYGGFAVASIWWNWTAPTDGHIQAIIPQASFNFAIAIYTGASVSNLMALARSTTGLTGYVPVTAGQTYHIAIASRDAAYSPSYGVVRWRMQFSPGGNNDDFADRTPLVGSSLAIQASNIGATTEPFEPQHASVPTSRSVWWRWRAPADGMANIWVINAILFNSTVAVYRGDYVTNLVAVPRGPFPLQYVFPAAAGEEFSICVASKDGRTGDFQLHLGLCTLRITLPTNGTVFELPTNVIIRWETTLPDPDITSFSLNSRIEAMPDPLVPRQLIATNPEAGHYELRPAISLATGFWDCGRYQFDVVNPSDTFSRRLTLTGTNVNVTGDARSATSEPGEPPGINSVASVWWTWTAPVSGRVLLDATRTAGTAVAEAFTGLSVSNLSPVPAVPGNFGWSVSAFDAIAGETYQLRAYPLHGSSIIPLTLRVFARPENDDFSDALTVGNIFTNVVDWFGASREANEPDHGSTAPLTVWYKWTCPRDGFAKIPLNATPYAGNSLANLAPVQRSASGFAARVDRVYRIALHGTPGFDATLGQPNRGTFWMRFVPAPVNDSITDAVNIGGHEGSIAGNNELATPEGNEPEWVHSVWYALQAPAGGALRIWIDTPITELPFGSAAIFTRDSATGRLSRLGAGNPVDVVVGSGVTYYIRVDGQDSDGTFDFRLHWELTPRPANDRFANALRLVGTRVQFTGTTFAATHETAEPVHRTSPGRSVWWKWTAPEPGWVTISATATGLNPWLGVYRGNALSKLVRVSTLRDTETGAAASFAAQQGVTYYLLVDIFPGVGLSYPGEPFDALLDLTTLEIISPPAGVMLTDSTPVELNINTPAQSADGTLAAVDYIIYSDGYGLPPRSLGSVTGPPFQLAVTNFPAGWHSITAYATNTTGIVRISRPRTFVIRPANDSFSARRLLTGHQVSVYGTMAGATRDAGESAIAGISSGRSVWYSWRAPATAQVRINLSQGYRTKVFVGNKLAALRSIPATNRQGAVSFRATRGTVYQFLVDTSYNGKDVGRFTFSLDQGTIQITNPVPDEIFIEPGPIAIEVRVSEPVEAGDTVDFFADESFLGTAAAPPYNFVWTNVPAGSHQLTARLKLSEGDEIVSPAVTILVRPSNDNFVNPKLITGTNGSFNYNLGGATKGSGEGEYSGVWFQWRAPAYGAVGFYMEPVLSRVLQIYSGTNASALTGARYLYFASGASGATVFAVEQDVDYAIFVGRRGEEHAAGKIDFRFFPAAANDNFSDRILLNGTNIVVPATTLHATGEPGEPEHAHSVWWSWTAPGNGVIRLSRPMAIYTGNSVSDLIPAPQPFLQEEAPTYVVRSNSTYHLAWDDPVAQILEASWTLAFEPAAPNDGFADRFTLAGLRAHAAGTTLGATREPGEPNHRGVTNGFSLWWTWIAPATAPVTIGINSFNLPMLAVYTGNDVASLVLVASQNNVVSFQAQEGIAYHIAADVRMGSPGPFTFSLLMDLQPHNDHFARREPLSGADVSVIGYNRLATREFREPLHAGEFGGRSVWYRWSPPFDANVRITLNSGNARGILAVYTGTVVTGLTEVASVYGGELLFQAVPGTEYQIAMDGYRGDFADFVLTLLASENSPTDLANLFIRADAAGLNLYVDQSANGNVIIESSADLVTWWPILTNAAPAIVPITFDPNAPTMQFFRAKLPSSRARQARNVD